MKRIYGILILLAVVYVLTAILSPGFLSGFNQENLLRRTALFGILGVGVAFVIITGGIDLSIGSIVALAGVSLPWFITQWGWHPAIVVLLVLGLPLLLGYAHGWLVTRMRLQPFIVTLCGLLIYRGLARGVTRDQTAGFGSDFRALRWLAQGEIPLGPAFGIPITVLIFAIVAVLAAVFLNKTIYGRYLLALGNNEEAARFSGIDTDRMTTSSARGSPVSAACFSCSTSTWLSPRISETSTNSSPSPPPCSGDAASVEARAPSSASSSAPP